MSLMGVAGVEPNGVAEPNVGGIGGTGSGGANLVPARAVPKASPGPDPLPEADVVEDVEVEVDGGGRCGVGTVGGTVGVVELDAGVMPKPEPKPELEPKPEAEPVVVIVPSPGRGTVLFTGDAHGVRLCILGIALRGVLDPEADAPAFEFVVTFVFRGGLAGFVFGVLVATVGVLGLL
jgi:hypothetical protein